MSEKPRQPKPSKPRTPTKRGGVSAPSRAKTPVAIEEQPMIEVHEPHETIHTWKEVFIHIGIVVVGLLLAISFEQTVEYFHHRSQAREARDNIQREMAENLIILQDNLQQLAVVQKQLSEDFDLLNSGASDAEVLPHLGYAHYQQREHDVAWEAAKINGSLALIPSGKITGANYFYESRSELHPTLFAYFTDMDTAGAILGHAKTSGKITASEREQLLSLTASAMGRDEVISYISTKEVHALQSDHLQ
jgi:hypothetical protein